ncbi:uncharacterized protein LOC131150529 [Malania oleifera]|uniref:uncharacterized protein LOC131150529 n=1 Tax=Malania oleifera TaxID=397392 RepID=UPI0025AEC139|nr:uncharacterized protein LOC131150529 [Malania oleifera]
MEPKDNSLESGSEETASDESPSVSRGLVRQRVGPSGMKQGRFNDVFFERYFAISTQDKKADEFSGLTQGTLIMQRYAARFIKLSRFALYLVLNEYKRLRATIVEIDLRGDEVVQEQRKRPVSSSSQSGPRQGQWKKKKNYNSGYQQSTERQSYQGHPSSASCAKCHKRHDGECQPFWGNCYNCGMLGHMSQSCQAPRRDTPA